MRIPAQRPAASAAGPELLVLQKWQDFTGWFLNHTKRWPKSTRFTLTRRLEDHALEVLESLVEARYEPRRRPGLLREINLRLERMRFLCRVAVSSQTQTNKGFESTMRQDDEVGRLIHAQRKIRKHPWFLKLDLRAFFPSLRHEVVLARLVQLIAGSNGQDGVGLGIGYLTAARSPRSRALPRRHLHRL